MKLIFESEEERDAFFDAIVNCPDPDVVCRFADPGYNCAQCWVDHADFKMEVEVTG